MPDSEIFPPMPSPTARHGERRSPERPSNGLPIFSTEKLTAAEDAMLGELARTFRLVAQRFDEARAIGTVARGLEVANLGERVGQVSGQCAATLGSRR